MAVVEFSIRNNIYQIACNDGEEAHLKSLAKSLAYRIDNLAKNATNIKDNTLLIMLALTLEDEICELQRNKPNSSIDSLANTDCDESVTNALNAISEYVETLVIKLKS